MKAFADIPDLQPSSSNVIMLWLCVTPKPCPQIELVAISPQDTQPPDFIIIIYQSVIFKSYGL